MIKYGQHEPPEYDLSKIKHVPIAIMAGTDDILASLADTRWIKDKLDPNVVVFHKEYNMGHISFVAGKKTEYIDDVLKLLKQYVK